MRNLFLCAAGASLLALSVSSAAGTYTFSNGNFSTQGLPSPLLSSDILNLTTTSTKTWNVDWTNEGTVNWQAGTVGIGSGKVITNVGTWNASSNNNFSGSGTFTNTGTLLKSAGTGTMKINSNTVSNLGVINVLSGTIALPSNFNSEGTLAGTGTYLVSGTLFNDGVIAPGDIGNTGFLTLSGNYQQSSNGIFAAQLASTTLFDQFKVTGTAKLDGFIELSCIFDCEIQDNDNFLLLTATKGLSGSFSNITIGGGFLDGFDYELSYDYTNYEVWLKVVSIGSSDNGNGGENPSEIPEPASWTLILAGFVLMGFAMRNRRRELSVH